MFYLLLQYMFDHPKRSIRAYLRKVSNSIQHELGVTQCCVTKHKYFESKRHYAKNLELDSYFKQPILSQHVFTEHMHLQGINKIFTILFPFSKKPFYSIK